MRICAAGVAHVRRFPLTFGSTLKYRYQRHRLGSYAIKVAVTIRNLSDEAHRALKVRAAQPSGPGR